MTRERHHLATVADFNEATGAGIDEQMLVGVLEELLDQGWLTGAVKPALTAGEVDFLDQHGGVRDNRTALAKARIASRTRGVQVEKESMSVEQAAQSMGLSASRVRHRLREGSLYAYPTRGRGVARRIPSWQFVDDAPVPHLAQVFNALPDDFTDPEIRDFALNAHVDHPTRDSVVPLLDWLRVHGDPAPAEELARAQDRLL